MIFVTAVVQEVASHRRRRWSARAFRVWLIRRV